MAPTSQDGAPPSAAAHGASILRPGRLVGVATAVFVLAS